MTHCIQLYSRLGRMPCSGGGGGGKAAASAGKPTRSCPPASRPCLPTAGEFARKLVAAWESLPKLYPPQNWSLPPPAGFEGAAVSERRGGPGAASPWCTRDTATSAPSEPPLLAPLRAGHSAREPGGVAPCRRGRRQRLAAPADGRREGGVVAHVLRRSWQDAPSLGVAP